MNFYEILESGHYVYGMDDYLTISQAADYLGVSIDTLRLWDEKGTLIAAKTVGGHRRYSKGDIARLSGANMSSQEYVRRIFERQFYQGSENKRYSLYLVEKERLFALASRHVAKSCLPFISLSFNEFKDKEGTDILTVDMKVRFFSNAYFTEATFIGSTNTECEVMFSTVPYRKITALNYVTEGRDYPSKSSLIIKMDGSDIELIADRLDSDQLKDIHDLLLSKI